MNFYLVLIVILMTIAVVDLIVGVSNDAVNFLNSAIGSRVASFRVILTVASIGILCGSLFSSGMMEIARNGIFNPSYFPFDKIMIVFMAVMLTDIILLDFFNSLGLPTSTTVSLIFELLGAALVTGLLLAFDSGYGFEKWPEIINYSSAVTIIIGIFLSVFLSFIVGSIVQHIARIIFTFKLKKSLRKYGAIFSGIAITAIIYFLLIKGAKGSSFITDSQVKWISANTVVIVLISMVFWSIIIQVLMWWKKINPLKIVVLLGTFSLAMAFAGNDLVNFIGVSVAGLVSFQAWTASGIPASDFTLGILNEKIVTPTWLLLVGGLVMVATLWTNSKSRKVTETEVSLGRQDDGDEKFKPNLVSRALVGSAVWIGRQIEKIIPERWSRILSIRFEKESSGDIAADQASFDLIRASINLVVASVLIAYGTSQKLPLSTTFVTFMVAMGSSFADQAWGRESAVYRVAGVINVIAGWLVTAIVALLSSGLLALIMYYTGNVGAIVLTAVAAFLLIRSHVVFSRKEKEEKADATLLEQKQLSAQQAAEESRKNTIQALETIQSTLEKSLRALLSENTEPLRKAHTQLEKLKTQNEKLDSRIIKFVRKMDKGNLATGRLYIQVFDLMQDLYQSTRLINDVIMTHVVNHHNPPKKKYADLTETIEKQISVFIKKSITAIATQQQPTFDEALHLQHFINKKLDELVVDIQNDEIGNRMGLLQTRLLLEMRDLIDAVLSLQKAYANNLN
ncbi:MAG: Phosphate transporter family protein [Bacteroidetes bacterium OLB12]|nr:MAG: Phosphate transporter family protein [Bacteroidetes bacterium OLB12]